MPSKKRKWKAGQTVYAVLQKWDPGRGFRRQPITGWQIIKLRVTNTATPIYRGMACTFDLEQGEASVTGLNNMEPGARIWGRWFFPTYNRALKAARDYNLKNFGVYDVPEAGLKRRSFYQTVDVDSDFRTV